MNYWTSVKLHLLYKPELTFFSVYYDTGTYRLGLVLLWNDFSSREWSRLGLSQIKFFGFCDFLWRFPWQNSFAHFAGKLIQKFVNLTAPSDQKEHNIATMFRTMFRKPIRQKAYSTNGSTFCVIFIHRFCRHLKVCHNSIQSRCLYFILDSPLLSLSRL